MFIEEALQLVAIKDFATAVGLIGVHMLYYEKNGIIIYNGDCLETLKQIPDNSVDTIVTSPPYWGLRDYGVEGQIGMETTIDGYIKKLLQITDELKRILKPTGVMFWNHGDSYGGIKKGKTDKKVSDYVKDSQKNLKKHAPKYTKCMMLQNYRLIIKMIDEQGWILRNTIVWYKPNHMPSSAKDRFTNAYENVFMLTKNKRYYFDLDAVRKPYTKPINRWGGNKLKAKGQSNWDKGTGQETYRSRDMRPNEMGKNPGDVWDIPTKPFKGAHFATFPEKLVEPMIKAGCPQWVCKKCGKARERIVKVERPPDYDSSVVANYASKVHPNWHNRPVDKIFKDSLRSKRQTVGWTDCDCPDDGDKWEAGVVLDPFMGSGTTLLVAKKLGRRAIGIELNKDYCDIAEARIKQAQKDVENEV